MGLPQFNEILPLSNREISEAILENENQLFQLRLKKATRQTFKSDQIQKTKRRLAQFKTLLTFRFQKLESKNENPTPN